MKIELKKLNALQHAVLPDSRHRADVCGADSDRGISDRLHCEEQRRLKRPEIEKEEKMAAEGQTGSKMLDEMPEYRIFELLKKYHYKYIFNKSAVEQVF